MPKSNWISRLLRRLDALDRILGIAIIVSAALWLVSKCSGQGFAITVPNPSAIERNEVAIAAVAVPRELNALSAESIALIDDAGLPVAVQWRALSRWGAPRENELAPLRWVQAAFPARVAPGSSRTYYAVIGQAKRGLLRTYDVDPIQIATGAGKVITIPRNALAAGITAEIDGAAAAVTETAIEYGEPITACIRQRGTIGPLRFTARWYFAHLSPVVRLDWRLENPGRSPHGVDVTPSVEADVVHFARMGLRVPSMGAAGGVEALTLGQSGPIWWPGSVSVAVDRANENAPKALVSDGSSIAVELWPAGGHGPAYGGQYWDANAAPLGVDVDARTRYRFEGGHWKTHTVLLDFSGGDAAALAVRCSPFLGYAAPWWTCSSGALGQIVQPAAPPATSIEADRFERLVRILYDNSAADDVPGLGRIGLPEFRRRGGTYANSGPVMWGWSNFGDIAWGDGYCSNHYALDWCTLVNWFRAGDYRAVDIGRDLVAHRRDYDQTHSIGDPDRGGVAYEKGASHGNAENEAPSHFWVQGMCAHYLITGDESTREALIESFGFVTRRNLQAWDGQYGSRILGWPLEACVHLYNTIGDQAYLDHARQLVRRWSQLEAGNGYWPNPAWASSGEPVPLPKTHEQTWMHCIVMGALGKYWIAETDPGWRDGAAAIMDRMARWVEMRVVRPDGRVWDRARGSLTPAADDWRQDVNSHHAWITADALVYAAAVTSNQHWLDVARPLWVQATRYPQGDRPNPGFDPISFRPETYPNAETKIAAGQVLNGLAAAAVLR